MTIKYRSNNLQGVFSDADTLHLPELVAEWENIQSQIRELRALDVAATVSGNWAAIDAAERSLQDQQNRVVQKIVNSKCTTIEDLICKLRIWQKGTRLGNENLGGFSMIDQIALSIDTKSISSPDGA